MSSNAFISRRQASNIHHAIRIANEFGPKLNYTMTINIGPYHGDIYAIFRELRCRFLNVYLREKCMVEEPTYVWVLERPNPACTPHIQFLINIPRQNKSGLERALRNWLSSRITFQLGKKAIKFELIDNIVGAKMYLLKGMDPLFAHIFNIEHEFQGIIDGKRAGYTNNIGPHIKRKLSDGGEYIYRKSVWFAT